MHPTSLYQANCLVISSEQVAPSGRWMDADDAELKKMMRRSSCGKREMPTCNRNKHTSIDRQIIPSYCSTSYRALPNFCGSAG